jgi:hypothetical protein
MMRTLVVLVTVVGCGGGGGGGGGGTPPAVDAPPSHEPDSAVGGVCHTEKIAFTQADGCGNDGGVEWCIPDNDAALQTQLATISSSIHCAPGGGRAMCSARPSLLLCSYPTAFPAQCSTDHGATTDEVWRDMCEIAALPQVTMIVKTILE